MAELKPGNTDKKDIAEKGITSIKKKIKSYREVPLQIKMETGNNLRIFGVQQLLRTSEK